MATLSAPLMPLRTAVPVFSPPWSVYASEVPAVRSLLPQFHRGVEIGVGTGRFAVPLGVPWGVEPSGTMGAMAQARGVSVIAGVAEALPFRPQAVDLVLLVTTVSFLPDVRQALREACRALQPGGTLVVADIDRASYWGRRYEARKTESIFYRSARFFHADKLATMIARAGFDRLTSAQTVFHDPERMRQPDPVKPGYGDGLFVVFSGVKAA